MYTFNCVDASGTKCVLKHTTDSATGQIKLFIEYQDFQVMYLMKTM